MPQKKTSHLLKVLHLSSERNIRGGEIQIQLLIEEQLKDPSLEVHLISRHDSSMLQWQHEMGVAGTSAAFRNSLDVFSAAKIASYAKAHQIDLIQVHTSKGHSAAFLTKVWGSSVPIIIHRRVPDPPSGSVLSRSKYNSKRVRGIICVSEYIKRTLPEWIYSHVQREVVHSAVRAGQFQLAGNWDALRAAFCTEHGIDPTQTLICMNSALSKEKGHHIALRALAALPEHERALVQLLIFGEGKDRSAIAKLAEKLGLKELVHFFGFRQDFFRILPLMDLLLFPSLKEGLGTGILQAQASGVPVIGSAVDGIPELIEPDTTGWLVPPGDASALAAQVQAFLNGKLPVQTVAEAAQQQVQQHFSPEAMAGAIRALYTAFRAH